MKRLPYILLIFMSLTLSVSSQYRTIDWQTNIDSVVMVSTDTFWTKVSPIDFNDPGAIAGYYGNYLIDFVGSRYSIVDSTSTAIKVVNEEAGLGVGPQSGQIGRVYRSVGDGSAPFIGGVDMTPLDESARWKKIAADNELFWSNMITMPLDSLLFSTDISGLAHTEGMMYFDNVRDNWIFFNSNDEISLDVGEELWTTVYNNTGVTIANGSVCVVTGNGGVVASVVLAKADYPNTINNKIGIATHDIEHGTYGKITIQGNVRDVNTSAYFLSEKLFISATTAGYVTNTKPSFPYYRMFVGYVNKVGTTDGIINVGITGSPSDIIGNLQNGSFNETFDLKVTSNGTLITGTLTNRSGNDFLTKKWSDGMELLDVSTPLTVTLTEGTDAIPQKQYLYLLKSTGNLTVSTSYWGDTEHIPISQLYLQSATATLAHDAFRNQNTNNHLASDDGMGGLDHMKKRIRVMPCEYESGIDITVVGSGTSNVYFTLTEGQAWQMHLGTYHAKDVSTDYALVLNNYTVGNTWVNNLTTITTDASGGTLNNNSFSVTIGGVENSTTETDQIFINMPTDTYNSSANAIADLDGYTVYSIPKELRGVGLLFYRLTFTNAGGNWTLNDTEDLRGLSPSTIAGGGVGGVGITTFLGATDTPSSYTGSGDYLVTVAAAENALEFTAKNTISLSDFNNDLISGTATYIPRLATSTTLENSGIIDLSDATAINITSSEYVGINITPTLPFHVEKSQSGFVARIKNTSSGNASLNVSAAGSGIIALFENGTTDRFQFNGDGSLQLHSYGDNTITGTPTTNAVFDTNGNLIEGSLAGATDLSLGTITAITIDVNSSTGTNATLLEANTTQAGILGSDKWDEIVENSLKVTNATHTGEVTGATVLTIADNIIEAVNFESTNSPTDNYFPSYDVATGGFTWVVGAGGASAIDDLSDAITDATSVFLGSGSGIVDDGTSNGNVGVGINSLNDNTSGLTNVAVGNGTLALNITGESNVAIGYQSIPEKTASDNNIGIGIWSQGNSSSGSQNISIGKQTLNNSSGNNNVAIGYFAGYSATVVSPDQTTANNTLVGYQSFKTIQTGANNNIGIGYNSGDNVTTGANNLIIGYDIDAQSATGSNQMSIGNAIFGTGISGTGTTINTSAKIGINDTSPSYTLDVAGSFRATTPVSTIQSGAKTASFTHDVSLGIGGAYTLSTSGAVTVSIHNLESGITGTIDLDIATNPSGITISPFSDAGSTALTKVVIGNALANETSKMTTVTYSCRNNSTGTYVKLIYGQE